MHIFLKKTSKKVLTMGRVFDIIIKLTLGGEARLEAHGTFWNKGMAAGKSMDAH